MRRTVGILGVPVDALDMPQAIARIEQFIADGGFHQVATANTDFLVNAVEDPELHRILARADLVVADGMPLVWASRLLRSPLQERVTGADLVPRLAEVAAAKGYRVFMLGARPDVAQRARAKLLERCAGIQIVGCVSPPVGPLAEMDDESILREIREARPDILLVAFGNPKQEKWISLNREGLQSVPVCVGVGGTFDFIAGQTARAPQWMQKTGLEWIFRLKQEPRRLWRRYTRDSRVFSARMLRQWSAVRSRRPGGSLHVTVDGGQACRIVRVIGDLTRETVGQVEAALSECGGRTTRIVLDLEGLAYVDGCGLGMLASLPWTMVTSGTDIRVVRHPRWLAGALERSELFEDGSDPPVVPDRPGTADGLTPAGAAARNGEADVAAEVQTAREAAKPGTPPTPTSIS